MLVNTYGIKNSRPVGGPGNVKELKKRTKGDLRSQEIKKQTERWLGIMLGRGELGFKNS
jgi:hypothetical protein